MLEFSFQREESHLSPPSKILYFSLELLPVAPNGRPVLNQRVSEEHAHTQTATIIQHTMSSG